MSWKEIPVQLVFAMVALVINAVAFGMMGVDKHRARLRAAGADERTVRRIPEATLLLWAACFGALGATLGMHFFRHKTRHWYFRWGLPVMLVLQLALVSAPWWFAPVVSFVKSLV